MMRAVGAFVVTIALVVGVPVLLIGLVGNPLPSDIPTIDEVRILLTQNGDGFANFLLGTLAVIIWLIWVQLTIALIAEIVATARQTETRRLPTVPGIQALAARLVATMTLAATLAAGPMLAPAVGALNLDDIAPLTRSTSVMFDVGSAGTALDESDGPRAATVSATTNVPAPGDVDGDEVRLTVTDHTELWDLAEAAYGDGVSWKLIAQANVGALDTAGLVITNETEAVAAGTTIVLPGAVDSRVNAHGTVLDHAAVESGETGSIVVAENVVEEAVGATDATRVVEPGDSMWSIAEDVIERQLDRSPSVAEVAEYWTEVVAANSDVPSGDVDLIHPGDELVLPIASGGLSLVEPGAAAPASPNLDGVVDGPVDQGSPPAAKGETSETGRTSETAASDRFEAASTDRAANPEVMSPNPSVQVDAPSAAGPPERESETVERSSARDAGPPERESETVERSSARDAGSSERESETVERSSARDAGSSEPDMPLVAVGLSAFGAAVMSAGITAAIHRRRDLQRRTRAPGTRPRPVSSDAAAFEAAMLHASHELREGSHGAGWRMMPAATVAAMRAGGPLQIHLAETGDLAAVATAATGDAGELRRIELDGTEVAHHEVVAMFESSTDGSTMGTADQTVADADRAPMPTTVLVGTATDTGEAVFVDLESAGAVQIAGSAGGLRRFARSAVVDLAVSDRADDLWVIAVAVGHEVGDLERVRPVDDFAGALAQALRCSHAGPDSPTAVVVVAAQPDEDPTSVQALLDLGALVIAPGVDAQLQIMIENEHATIWPAGTIVELAGLDDDAYRAVSELVETTSPAVVEPVDESLSIDSVLDVVPVAGCPVEAGPIEVKVLGPVEIAGAESFSSLKAVDVVTYLAFHRHGVDADQIKAWVWPTFEPPTDKAFANVLSRARTALGTDVDGSPFLSRAGTDRTYRLSEAVTTDFDRFRAIVAMADGVEETAAVGDGGGRACESLTLLMSALDLIRGVPFTGGSASSFAWADNHVRAQIEYTIDETVHRCADLALEVGDLTTARWAALKGLELVPGCEQCFRRRFLIAGAGNNRTELRRAMADLEASASCDLGEPEAVDLISGDLLELYHELDQALVAGPA